MKGFFITFEGIEGAGKTTQAKALSEELLKCNFPVVLTREPGGSPVGDKIRKILADPENDISPMTEFLLYAAARAEHADKLLRPYLEEGYVVISDRFMDSSVAYQAFARELPLSFVDEVNSEAAWEIFPDLTFYLDLTPEESVKRVKLRNEEMELLPERLEREKTVFFRKAREGYMHIRNNEPARFRLMDAMLPPEELHRKIVDSALKELRRRGIYPASGVNPETVGLNF